MKQKVQLDEIMTCSKEAIARAYMCINVYNDVNICPAGLSKGCPLIGIRCGDVTPQDWQEVLDERD